MIKASYHRHTLEFKQPSGTSRGVLHQKETWYIQLFSENKVGIGECGILRGLSFDDRPDYEEKLAWVCQNISMGESYLLQKLTAYPSIQMGLECAFLSLESEHPFLLFDNHFSMGEKAIPINGLIWMGDVDFMIRQVKEKLEQGFGCLKMKIGAIDFDQEVSILKSLRNQFSSHDLMIRVDANGAFGVDAIEKLELLAQLDIHSIEQPIAKGQWEAHQKLCAQTPLPIALDEELIGCIEAEEQAAMLDFIKPHYIILKPSFIGGLTGAKNWHTLAKERNIGAWVTSALESNIGLNAIAQWTFQEGFKGPQGLGTGGLFTNNIELPLHIKNGYLSIDKTRTWPKLPFPHF